MGSSAARMTFGLAPTPWEEVLAVTIGPAREGKESPPRTGRSIRHIEQHQAYRATKGSDRE
jgi:hypothetical protein